MTMITVVGRDNSNTRHGYEAVLIYTFDVNNPSDYNEVCDAFIEQRAVDREEEVDPEDIEVLFCFAGNIQTLHDWR